ncbi:MAG: hypothetical protein ABEL97_04300 [Salinibacter sp.]
MPYRYPVLFVLFAVLSTPALGQSPEQWSQRVDYEMDITLHADDHQKHDDRQPLEPAVAVESAPGVG